MPETGIRLLENRYLIDVWEGELPPTHEELLRVQGVSSVLTMLSDKIDKEVIKAAGESVKVIANYAVGYDNIDLAAIRLLK
ncbi:MAG: hypothetical protein K8R40_10175 [Anaerolineaceae bacterium]|nr:hypothetical protein [Anaerolineaceae bacterium]